MLGNDLSPRPERNYLLSLVYILVLVGLGFVVVGPFIGFFLSLAFFPGDMFELVAAVQDPFKHPEVKLPLFIIQAFSTIVGLILTPLLILNKYQVPLKAFFRVRDFTWVPVAITTLVVIFFVGVNSLFAEWNYTINFPEGFDSWAREREESAAELTKFLTTLSTVSELVIALIVIAVLPALGEEIVFRGLIQNELSRGTGNIHVSIWISAILFSAIHLQFFGFVPRLLLGALFGYLYYWSGNLWLAIIAHFVNNALAVIAVYYYQRGAFEFDPEKPEALPLSVVMFSAAFTAVLLFYFYKYFENRKPPIPQL